MEYTLKLKKAKSYSGIVRATESNPIVTTEDETVALAAIATGYFDLIEGQFKTEEKEQDIPEEIHNAAIPEEMEPMFEMDMDEDPAPEAEPAIVAPAEANILKMNKPELLAYASLLDVDVKSCKTKTNLIEAINGKEKASESEVG